MPQDSNNPRRASYGTGQVQLFSFLFKGFLVTISPILGLGLLKIIFFVFTNPKYFFFAWLLVLAVGLVAEFFTDTWRPSQFNRNNQAAPPNSNGHSSNIQNTKNDNGLAENKSPTILFKSQAAIPSHTVVDQIADAAADSKVIFENKGSGVEEVSSEETTSSMVQVETRVKIGSRSRAGSSPSPRSRSSSSSAKGYGKPILLRMDYKLESRNHSKGVVEPISTNPSSAVTKTEEEKEDVNPPMPSDVPKKDHKKRSHIHSIVPSDIRNSNKKTAIRDSEENLIDHLHFSSMINLDDENNFPEYQNEHIESKSNVGVDTASKEWGIFMYQNTENEKVNVELAVEATEGTQVK